MTGQTGRREAWKASLHGGHSGEFCDHAQATLREMVAAAAAFGYHTFGVSEHVPRPEAYVYSEERALGWDADKLQADFTRYTAALQPLVTEYADRLIILRGFEAEIVPEANYVEVMRGLRNTRLPDDSPAFDYFVGSVHFLHGVAIDGKPEKFLRAVEAADGLEALAVHYYNKVGEMALALRPDVVGHFDLIKRNVTAAGLELSALETPAVHRAATVALEAILASGAVLDLNTAGWRKGLGEPYPAPHYVKEAYAMGLGFCFGDDSHRPTDVGAGVLQARDYLLSLGVPEILVLTRDGDPVSGPIGIRVISLI